AAPRRSDRTGPGADLPGNGESAYRFCRHTFPAARPRAGGRGRAGAVAALLGPGLPARSRRTGARRLGGTARTPAAAVGAPPPAGRRAGRLLPLGRAGLVADRRPDPPVAPARRLARLRHGVRRRRARRTPASAPDGRSHRG